MEKKRFLELKKEIELYIELLKDSYSLSKKDIQQEKENYIECLFDNSIITDSEYKYLLKHI